MKIINKKNPDFIIFVPVDEDPHDWLRYYMGLSLEDFHVCH